MTRVAVMWPRLGPYHIARLNKAANVLEHSGVQIIGLETTRTEARYAWTVIEGNEGFQRYTIFPDRDYLSLNRAQLHAGTKRTLDKLRPHVIVVCGWAFPESCAAIAWGRLNGCAIVVSSDTTARETSSCWLRSAVKRRILSQCDSVFVSGSRSRDYVVSLGFPEDAVVTGCDVVDNSFFSQNAASTGTPAAAEHGKYWLTVSRFIPEKNLLIALKAYAAYRKQVSQPWDWVICGDGPLRDEIAGTVHDLDLEQCVYLPGFLQLPDLPSYYAGGAAMWLPSIRDTWGLVVNEAMACGLPVVVSDAAGCAPDLVEEDGNGWLCNPESVDDMMRVLVRMHTASPDRLSAMGRRSREIISQWDLDRYADGLLKASTLAMERAKRRRKGVCCVDRFILSRV